jgi:simple sugar transport system ATP-binding protein
VRLTSPTDAQRLGIATVYQDLALAPELAASENLYLGRELLKAGVGGRLGILDRKSMRREAASQFAKLGIHLRSPAVSVASLSGGQRQSIAIARAAMWANKVIFMDEPTAALGVVQTARVLDLIRSVRDSGIAVVLISHNMSQVIEVADRVEVLRLGHRVAAFQRQGLTVERLVAAMTSGAASQEPVA